MNEEKKRPETPETPKKKNAISLGKIFYHNTFVLAFSFVVAVVTWFLMYANSAERNVVIHDVPITQQVSSAAQEEGSSTTGSGLGSGSVVPESSTFSRYIGASQSVPFVTSATPRLNLLL